MHNKIIYPFLIILSSYIHLHEQSDILITLKQTHDPLVAHELIMDYGKSNGKITNQILYSLFNRAHAQQNFSAQIHISNSYHVCKATASKDCVFHPIGCVAHLTLANLITMLAEVSPFKLSKYAYDRADAPLDYEALRKQAQKIIKKAITEKNIFAFLVQILMKNATLTGLDNSSKLFKQVTHLLVTTRQKKEPLISDELLETLLSFSKNQSIDQKNAEALYSYILLKSCLQNNKLSSTSSFYPASILGYIQKYQQFEELHFWLGALLYNSTDNALIRTEALRQLLKSKLVPVYIEKIPSHIEKLIKNKKEYTVSRSLQAYLDTIGFTIHQFDENLQIYEPALLFTAKKFEHWDAFVQSIATITPRINDLNYYSTFYTTNAEQAFRFSEGIQLKTIVQNNSLPILAISRDEKLIATLTPLTFAENKFTLSKMIIDGESALNADLKIIDYLESWYSRNPTLLFEKQDIWHYKRIFRKSKEFCDFLDNKTPANLPRLARQFSDPLPRINTHEKLQAKELIVKKFTVSFHEEILSSGSDEEPKNVN